MAMSFNFVLSNNSANGYFTTSETEETGLLGDSNFQDSSNILTATADLNNGGIDAFGGKDIFGTCDLSNMNQSFVAEASVETAGSVACGFSGSMGAIASASVETAGSVACSGSDSGASSCSSFSSFC